MLPTMDIYLKDCPSVSAVLDSFLKLDKSGQQAIRTKVEVAVDPTVSAEQRLEAEKAVLAHLGLESGPKVAARAVSREERLSPEQRALRERMDRQEVEFSRRLSQLMAERQMTQTELARLVGVGQSAVSMLLSRKCQPQPRTLGKIAEALGVKVEDLWPGKLGPGKGP